MTANEAKFRREAEFAAAAAITLLVICWLGVAAMLGGSVLESVRASGWRGTGTLALVGERLLTLSPGIFYLCALGELQRTFAAAGSGDRFGPAIVRGVRGAGQYLLIGGLFATVFAPSLLRWLDRPGGVEIEFNITNVAITMVGLALTLLARLLARAARLEAELDSFV